MAAVTLLLLLSGMAVGLQAAVPASIVDPQSRSAYHFRPPYNWINDPNGPMYYKGMYHLFYQYNPNGSVWGNIVWGHSVSKDLINWDALPIAIYPTSELEAKGCWSGSATVLPHGRGPVIVFTMADAHMNQTQALALPKNPADPYLREWYKPGSINPVILPPPGINHTQFRDPTTAWYGPDGHWRLLIGTAVGDRGMALVYRSRDFKHWTKEKEPLHSALNGMWECPDMYPVPAVGTHGLDTSAYGAGIKHVLKASLDRTRYDYYTMGTYDRRAHRYVPDAAVGDERLLRYDYGNFYASKTFYDPSKGRRILLGWANESDSTEDDIHKGWAGIHAIPRRIWVDPSGRQLLQWPVEEVGMLRGKKVHLENMILNGGAHHLEVKGLQNPAQADVEVRFEVGSLEKAEELDPAWSGMDAQALCGIRGADVSGGVGPFGLWVLASEKLEEKTALFFRLFKGNRPSSSGSGQQQHLLLFCTDPSRSSLTPDGLYKPTFAGFVDLDIATTKTISLRALIDHSVVEGFAAGGKVCILSRVYPSLALGPKAHLLAFNNGAADVKLVELSAWDMSKPRIA